MNWFIVYLFLKLDALESLCFGIALILSILLFVFFLLSIVWTADAHGEEHKRREEEKDKFFAKFFYKKLYISVFVICILLTTFLPSTQEFAVIYLLPKIVNNEQIQQIPNKALDILNKKLDEWASDFSQNKK